MKLFYVLTRLVAWIDYKGNFPTWNVLPGLTEEYYLQQRYLSFKNRLEKNKIEKK